MRARIIYAAGHAIGADLDSIYDALGPTAAVTHLVIPAEGCPGLDAWSSADAHLDGAKLNSTATAIVECLMPCQLNDPLYGAVIFTGATIDGVIQPLTEMQDSILADMARDAQVVAA